MVTRILLILPLLLALAASSSGSLPFPADADQSGAPHGHDSITSVRNLTSGAEHEPPVRYRHGAPQPTVAAPAASGRG